MPKANLWGHTPAQKRRYNLSRLEEAPRQSINGSWAWYSWGFFELTPRGVTGPKLASVPAVYRIIFGSSMVYIGETSRFGTRVRTHRQKGTTRVCQTIREYLEHDAVVSIESMENILLDRIRGYGLENSLVRQSLEGMAILQARMSNLEVLNFNLSPTQRRVLRHTEN